MKITEAMKKGFEGTIHAERVWAMPHSGRIFVCPDGAILLGILGQKDGLKFVDSIKGTESANRIIREKIAETFPEIEKVIDINDIPEAKEFNKVIDKEIESRKGKANETKRERFFMLFHVIFILVDFFNYDRNEIVKFLEARGF